MVKHTSYNPWSVVTLVLTQLAREGLRPRLAVEDTHRARQAAIELLDALNLVAEVHEGGEDS
ncbi:hypothetical protein [Saccharomonospora iraqiensis]|uniref:hypothetical protein n=1 Tax=Saccharomonospora iraqiensis TaxID=52698 RepID=UPI0012B5467D|nr:hypothetical protein [Saccharomonospora iraqiensis]